MAVTRGTPIEIGSESSNSPRPHQKDGAKRQRRELLRSEVWEPLGTEWRQALRLVLKPSLGAGIIFAVGLSALQVATNGKAPPLVDVALTVLASLFVGLVGEQIGSLVEAWKYERVSRTRARGAVRHLILLANHVAALSQALKSDVAGVLDDGGVDGMDEALATVRRGEQQRTYIQHTTLVLNEVLSAIEDWQDVLGDEADVQSMMQKAQERIADYWRSVSEEIDTEEPQSLEESRVADAAGAEPLVVFGDKVSGDKIAGLWDTDLPAAASGFSYDAVAEAAGSSYAGTAWPSHWSAAEAGALPFELGVRISDSYQTLPGMGLIRRKPERVSSATGRDQSSDEHQSHEDQSEEQDGS